MIKPKALQKGDLVAIAAPASPFDKGEFLFAIERLKKLGFEVTFRKDIFSKKFYLAGSDERRANEINGFFEDPTIKAIFFARGGYGTQRIIHLLDLEAIKSQPKIMVGYSDITALFNWLHKHEVGGLFYGPTIAKHFKQADKKTIETLFNSIGTNEPLGKITSTGAKALKHGEAEGTLVGGCLSLITSSIGTPYDLPTDNTILFLEDVNEDVYKYDRMLTHLKHAGKFRDVRALIFGSMGLSKGEDNNSFKKMLTDVLADFPGPIITNFPTGHFPLNKLFITLPLGVNCKVSTKPLSVEITEQALE